MTNRDLYYYAISAIINKIEELEVDYIVDALKKRNSKLFMLHTHLQAGRRIKNDHSFKGILVPPRPITFYGIA